MTYDNAWESCCPGCFYQKELRISVDMVCIHDDEQEEIDANEKPERFEVNKCIGWYEKIID